MPCLVWMMDNVPMQVNNAGINIRKKTTVSNCPVVPSAACALGCCATVLFCPSFRCYRAQDFTAEDYQRLMATNLESAFNLSQVPKSSGRNVASHLVGCLTQSARLSWHSRSCAVDVPKAALAHDDFGAVACSWHTPCWRHLGTAVSL